MEANVSGHSKGEDPVQGFPVHKAASNYSATDIFGLVVFGFIVLDGSGITKG